MSEGTAIVEGLTPEQSAELFGLLSKLIAVRGLNAAVHAGYRDGPR